MKKTLFILSIAFIFYFSESVYSFDQIDGGFGFKLGAKIDTSPIEVIEQRGDMYIVKPIVPHNLFTEYHIHVTPKSRLIYRIVGIAKGKNIDTKFELNELFKSLAKYGTFNNNSDKFGSEYFRLSYNTSSNDDYARIISFSAHEDSDKTKYVFLEYTDLLLAKVTYSEDKSYIPYNK